MSLTLTEVLKIIPSKWFEDTSISCLALGESCHQGEPQNRKHPFYGAHWLGKNLAIWGEFNALLQRYIHGMILLGLSIKKPNLLLLKSDIKEKNTPSSELTIP